MLQVGRGLDLGQEPLGSDHRRQLGLQNLERHLALVLQIVRQVHRGHAALTELALDGVAAFQGCVQARDGIGLGRTPGSDRVNILPARRSAQAASLSDSLVSLQKSIHVLLRLQA